MLFLKIMSVNIIFTCLDIKCDDTSKGCYIYNKFYWKYTNKHGDKDGTF